MPVTSPHAIYGTGGGYPECTFSMVWPSERTQCTDAKNIKGKKSNKISFLWSQVRLLPHCHSPTKGKTFVWLGWASQNSNLVSSWRLKNGVPIRTPVGSWPLATLEMRKKLGRVSFRQEVSGITTDRQSSIGQFFSCPQWHSQRGRADRALDLRFRGPEFKSRLGR